MKWWWVQSRSFLHGVPKVSTFTYHNKPTSRIVSISQMATYWFVIGELNIQKAQKSKVRQTTKMLLSLRSNPQTRSPYIQNCDGLCTRTDHHMLLPIVLYMVVSLYWNNDNLTIWRLSFVLRKDRWLSIGN